MCFIRQFNDKIISFLLQGEHAGVVFVEIYVVFQSTAIPPDKLQPDVFVTPCPILLRARNSFLADRACGLPFHLEQGSPHIYGENRAKE